MITSNKKVSLFIASAILISPLMASADDMSVDSTTNMNMGQSQMMSGILSPEQKEKLEAQKEKVGAIMKSLEADLKYIRENLTKENAEELKKKAEELKLSYLAKINEVLPNTEEAKKIIENRFKIFWNNQFIIREQVKEIKDKAISTASGTINKAKEIAKDAMEKARETKKQENSQIREENKQIKTDLKAKYKTKFVAQIKNKLDNLSDANLEKIIANVEKKREIIASNEKIKAATKEKYLAQLDALLEILKEKLNPSEDEELNIEEILNEATN